MHGPSIKIIGSLVMSGPHLGQTVWRASSCNGCPICIEQVWGIHAIGFSGQFLKECNWLEGCFGFGFGFLPTNYLSYKHWPKTHLLPILGWKLVVKINADKGELSSSSPCPRVLLVVHGHFVPVFWEKIKTFESIGNPWFTLCSLPSFWKMLYTLV